MKRKGNQSWLLNVLSRKKLMASKELKNKRDLHIQKKKRAKGKEKIAQCNIWKWNAKLQ